MWSSEARGSTLVKEEQGEEPPEWIGPGHYSHNEAVYVKSTEWGSQKSSHTKYFSFLAKVQGSFVFRLWPVTKHIPEEMVVAWENLEACTVLIENYILGFLTANCCPRMILNIRLSTQFTRLLICRLCLLSSQHCWWTCRNSPVWPTNHCVQARSCMTAPCLCPHPTGQPSPSAPRAR